MARKGPPTLAPPNFNEVVRDVPRLAAPDAEAREIVIREELDDALPTTIGDRIQLQQVILNLLINAVQAMRNAMKCVASNSAKAMRSPPQEAYVLR